MENNLKTILLVELFIFTMPILIYISAGVLLDWWSIGLGITPSTILFEWEVTNAG